MKRLLIELLAAGAVIGAVSFAAGGADAMSRSAPPSSQVSYTCSGGADVDAEKLEMVCAALRAALASRLVAGAQLVRASRDAARGLHVEVLLERAERSFLKGHLVWVSCPGGVCGAETAGPPVETSSMDATLSAQSYDEFVRGLLTITQLPI